MGVSTRRVLDPLEQVGRSDRTKTNGPCNAVDLNLSHITMSAANNSNESYCTFTLASDVTAGGLPSEEEIAKQLESNDPKVCIYFLIFGGGGCV